ncbi:MAG: M50 family metallopeptidase [Acidimicrobiales bacterium]
MVNLDEVAPEDEGRTYRQKPFWDRIGVAVAGSAMHFLLALVLIYVALVFVGQPAGSMTSDVGSRPAVLAEVLDGTGASDAGLRVGDEVIDVDGTEITSAREALRDAAAAARPDRAGDRRARRRDDHPGRRPAPLHLRG